MHTGPGQGGSQSAVASQQEALNQAKPSIGHARNVHSGRRGRGRAHARATKIGAQLSVSDHAFKLMKQSMVTCLAAEPEVVDCVPVAGCAVPTINL